MSVQGGPEPEQFMSVPKVAELFDVTGETVRDWLNSGKLKGIKINGYWKVAKSEVVAFGKARFQA